MTVIDSLKEHSQYLSTALELIPADVYFSNEGIKEKYWRKDKRKKGTGQDKITARKSKKAKFDPDQHKSNWDITKEREEQEMIAKSTDKDKIGQNVEKLKGSDVNNVKIALQNKIQLLEKKRKRKSQDDAANMNKIKKRRDNNRKAKKAKKISSSHASSTKKQQHSDDSKNEASSNKLFYSKFEINPSKSNEMKGKKKKKDLKTILQSVQNKEAKIKEIGQTDKVKAIEIKDKMIWKSAVEKAKGTKVKDDPKLLKKSIKRQEKKKEKSKREWKQRIQSQQNATKERQMKRKKNIKERIQHKKARKIKSSK